MIMSSGLTLDPVAQNTGEWLHRWAAETPDAVFLAERSGPGWNELKYGDALSQVQAVAAGLLDHGVGPGEKIVILSGPGIKHGILKLAAQYIGVATVPVAEQYSLIPDAQPRLIHIAEKICPAMVFAEDAEKFARGLALPQFDNALKVVGGLAGTGMITFERLLASTTNISAARDTVTPQTLAKILFTSGSTSTPKGVPQTHHMMCVNQNQYSGCLPFLKARPPVILSWLPWNHVFAGNSNFNMALAFGGALYLDTGKPVKGLFDTTLENLRMVKPTMSANVPVGYAMLVEAMREDAQLRHNFFADLDFIFYAGASLPADVWQGIEELAMIELGRVPMLTSSWGMTETAPMALMHYEGNATSGMIGIPGPELEARLLPIDDNRYELRVRGPNVMEGYYEEPEKNAETFDDEGFMKTGDAVCFADPDRLESGLQFDGRIGEDFKLLSAVWVQSARLRLGAMPALAGLAQDIVITGENRTDLGLLVFPDPQLGLQAGDDGTIQDAHYCAKIRSVLAKLAETATGSSNRIVRAIVLGEPPSVKAHEITAKGNLNNNAVLRHRAGFVERLYDDSDPATIQIG
ncbi:MAG: AMP-binding protein [Alphaproteobacteria bacterium]|nr:AMP-binding protein [Alphaproteobacteria bacterium]